MSSERADLPWGLRAARTTTFTIAAGLATIACAWWQTSATGHQSRQIPWVSIGIVAVVAIGVGNVSWLASGRRAVLVRQAALLARLDDVLPSGPDAIVGVSRLVAVVGSPRYHRPDCVLSVGKPIVDATASDGLRPCEMCEP